MDRKEKILSYMCSKEYIPLKFAELMTVLDVPAEDEEELRDILTELCIEGKIYMTKKGRYMSVEGENSTVVGKLVCNACLLYTSQRHKKLNITRTAVKMKIRQSVKQKV